MSYNLEKHTKMRAYISLFYFRNEWETHPETFFFQSLHSRFEVQFGFSLTCIVTQCFIKKIIVYFYKQECECLTVYMYYIYMYSCAYRSQNKAPDLL